MYILLQFKLLHVLCILLKFYKQLDAFYSHVWRSNKLWAEWDL
jgi:hypothetical protein